jgi:hypothetical protein
MSHFPTADNSVDNSGGGGGGGSGDGGDGGDGNLQQPMSRTRTKSGNGSGIPFRSPIKSTAAELNDAPFLTSFESVVSILLLKILRFSHRLVE